ncbi:MAG: hypothetical protein F8N15_05005, partial [Methanobacterium sp.]|nr:hypothetical protein [Methanobacterium sp.]
MADQTRINTLVVRSQLEGIDQAKAQIAGLGSQFDQTSKSLDTMGAKQDAWREHLNALAQGLSTTGDHLSGISSKLDMTARAAGAASLAFDSIGMDPLAAGAAQLSGRISEVSEGFDALSGLASKSADAIGTHTDALSQAVDRYRELSEAQQDSSDASSMSTAGWVAAGVAGVALVGVTAGVVVGVMAAKDALLAAADATGLWAKEVLTGGILDNMEKLVATGHQLNDISTTTGVAAQNFSILATGLQGSGLSADTTQHLLTGLQKTLVDTSSQAVEARITMREMGIDLESVGKNGNDVQSVFLAVAGTLSQYQDGAEKTALAQKLLGDSSAEVIKGVDGAVDAYSRIDAQTRANIANTAAYAAATDDMIAKFKDLRDHQPPTLFQSQMSGGFAEIGGGFKQLGAGFNWGAGLFSHAGRDVMSAGITDIEKGFSVLWNTVDESWAKVNLTTTSWVDKIFGTHQADEVREHLQNLSATIADNMPKPGVDTRSALHGDPYGSYAWATSSATQLAAQYDPATAALATYTKNYEHILDLYKMGTMGAEAFNQALQEQTDAFLKASDPVGTYVANLQKVLDIKAANVPGPARDAALQKQQIVDSLKSSVKRPLTGGELNSIDGIVSQTTDQNAADQAYQKAQSDAQSAAAQAKANAESARQTIQNVGLQADAQDRLTAAIGKGWLAQQQADAENQIASAVAQNGAINQDALRAAYDAVTSAKQRNIDASTGDKLRQELDLAKMTADAHQQGAAAIADLATQTGHYQDVLAGVSPAQQAVNDNLRQQIEYQKEISAASDYGRNLQNETDVAQKQLDILTQTKGVRTQEVEALKQRLQIEQQFPNIDAATKSSLIFQADQLAEVKGRVQDITKAYQEQQREIQQVSDQIANSLGNGITDALKNGTSAWDKMLKSWHSMLDTFIGQMAAQFLKTEIVVPIVAQVVGGHAASLGGTAAGLMGGDSSSGIGGLLNVGSTANTVSGWFGGPSISGSSIFGSQGLGITGEGGYLSQAGSYLFGNAATPGIGAGAGLVPGDIVAGETLPSADFAAPASEGLLS